jgi:hypothetical protein
MKFWQHSIESLSKFLVLLSGRGKAGEVSSTREVNVYEMSAPGGSPFEDIEEDDTLTRILDRTEDVSALIQEAKVRRRPQT